MTDTKFGVKSLIGGLSAYAGDRIMPRHGDELTEELSGAQGTLFKTSDDFAAEVGLIRSDNDLSEQGKQNKIQKQASTALGKVDRLMNASPAKWQTRLDALARQALAKLPTPPADTILASDTRAYVRGLSSLERMRFVRDHLADPLVAATVMNSPSFLLGVTEEELDRYRDQVLEALAPELLTRINEIRYVLDQVKWTARAVRRQIAKAGGLPVPTDDEAEQAA